MDMEKIADSLTLHNGLKIPGLGFGVWQISPLHTAGKMCKGSDQVRIPQY